ncbi:MAG TPA: cellulose binding domain-containing protein, partial [Polyangiaceae bacterium]
PQRVGAFGGHRYQVCYRQIWAPRTSAIQLRPASRMNKTWQLRRLAVYLALGASLAAACAREVNTLVKEEGDVTSESGTHAGGGGQVSPGKGGSSTSAFGGTSSKGGGGKGGGGKGGGVSSQGGGVSSQGGEGGSGSVGGLTGSAGKAGAAGASGAGGGSGSGGATTVPPDMLARASAVVYYETSHTMATDGTIQMKLYIVNQGPDPLPVANLALRYWFTAETAPELHQYFHGAAYTDDSASFVDAAADSHVLMTFSGSGTLSKGQDRNLSEVQLQITSNVAKFDQSDDFSWAPGSTSSQPNPKLSLYLDDRLIWGCEPSGACFDDGGAGAGGAPP